jgi:hypothetical protein
VSEAWKSKNKKQDVPQARLKKFFFKIHISNLRCDGAPAAQSCFAQRPIYGRSLTPGLHSLHLLIQGYSHFIPDGVITCFRKLVFSSGAGTRFRKIWLAFKEVCVRGPWLSIPRGRSRKHTILPDSIVPAGLGCGRAKFRSNDPNFFVGGGLFFVTFF